jgi:hypothetical protein
MIEEQELLQGAWIELAIFTEQQRRLRDAIGLPRTLKFECEKIAATAVCSYGQQAASPRHNPAWSCATGAIARIIS